MLILSFDQLIWKLHNFSTLSLENCMLLAAIAAEWWWLQLSKDNHHEENGWFFPVKHKMQQSLTFQLLYINWRCQNTFKVLSHILHLFFTPFPDHLQSSPPLLWWMQDSEKYLAGYFNFVCKSAWLSGPSH